MSLYMINATQGHAIAHLPANIREKHDGSFDIRSSKPKIHLKVNDEFTSITNNPETDYLCEKVEMVNKGVVNKVSFIETKDLTSQEKSLNEYRRKKGKTPLKYYIHTVEFKGAEPFRNHRYLDDYTYSLLKIYKRYIKPVRHFSRVITELKPDDFETLKKERIYVERTLFGRLINSLPYQNRLQFILFAIEKFEQADIRKIKYSKVFPELKSFVGTGVVDIGKNILKSHELLREMKEVFDNNINIGFSFESQIIKTNPNKKLQGEDIKIDYLEEQAVLFREVFEIENDFENLFTSKNINMSNSDRLFFDNIFSKRSWPVDLNTDYK